jgi:hypothetical protein
VRGMRTQTGVVVGRLAERGIRKVARADAAPACLAAMLCIIAITACSNAAPSVPATVAGSAGASGPSASGTSTSGITFGTFDACALLPGAALSKIVGGTPRAAPMPSVGWMAGQCAWSSATSGFFLGIGTASSIQKASDPAAPDAKAKLAQFRQRASGTTKPKDVAGIGDGAVLGTTGMAAYKDGMYLEVTRLKVTDDQLIKILKIAVANL